MSAASYADQRFLSENDGTFVGSLSEDDQDRFWALVRSGHAAASYNLIGLAKVVRIPVAYGDGKKSPYGVTYADQINDDFLGEASA